MVYWIQFCYSIGTKLKEAAMCRSQWYAEWFNVNHCWILERFAQAAESLWKTPQVNKRTDRGFNCTINEHRDSCSGTLILYQMFLSSYVFLLLPSSKQKRTDQLCRFYWYYFFLNSDSFSKYTFKENTGEARSYQLKVVKLVSVTR